MSRGVNKLILIGHCGKEPEVRFAPSGTCFANVTLATSESWKDRNTGEQREETQWHNLVFNGRVAEVVGEYVHKGSKIYVEGSVCYEKWKGQDGVERNTTKIKCYEMQLLDAPSHEGLPPEARTPPASRQQPTDENHFDDDDIPF